MGILIFLSIFLIIIGVMVFRFCYRIYRRIRDTKQAVEDALNGTQRRDYTGRKAQQYHFDERSSKRNGQHSTTNDQTEEAPRRMQTQSGEVIIDHNHQERENRKIFDDSDGEYVDFEEA